jgi:hypothetical protein
MTEAELRMIELLQNIKALVLKGMPGYYVSRQFIPIENTEITLDAQERFFLIRTVRGDLPNMKLTEGEKATLESYLKEFENIAIEEEIRRIVSSAVSKISSAISDILKNKKPDEDQ